MLIGVIILLHVVVCILLILIVMVQSGRVGELGAAFGISSSQSLFGPRRGNILTRITAICAGVFMLSSLILTILIPRMAAHVKTVKPQQTSPPPITQPQTQTPTAR